MTDGWHVLGIGAIGGLFAKRLHEASLPVTLIDRHPSSSNRLLNFIERGHSAQLELPCEPASSGTAIRRLLVCTKSHSVVNAINSVANRLSPDSEIAILVNGMGIGEQVRDALPQSSILLGTTTAGCFRNSKGAWHPVADGETVLGWFSEPSRSPPDWLEDWQRAIPGFSWTSNIEQPLLEKLAINAVINPATALFDIRNGQLLDEPYREPFEKAVAEAVSVFDAAGYAEVAEKIPARVRAVAEATASNTSSMRADKLAQRTTEIEAILGYLLVVLKRGSTTPPPTPLLDSWLAALRDHDAACAKALS